MSDTQLSSASTLVAEINKTINGVNEKRVPSKVGYDKKADKE